MGFRAITPPGKAIFFPPIGSAHQESQSPGAGNQQPPADHLVSVNLSIVTRLPQIGKSGRKGGDGGEGGGHWGSCTRKHREAPKRLGGVAVGGCTWAPPMVWVDNLPLSYVFGYVKAALGRRL